MTLTCGYRVFFFIAFKKRDNKSVFFLPNQATIKKKFKCQILDTNTQDYNNENRLTMHLKHVRESPQNYYVPKTKKYFKNIISGIPQVVPAY